MLPLRMRIDTAVPLVTRGRRSDSKWSHTDVHLSFATIRSSPSCPEILLYWYVSKSFQKEIWMAEYEQKAPSVSDAEQT